MTAPPSEVPHPPDDAARPMISSMYRRVVSFGCDQVMIEQTVSVPHGSRSATYTAAAAADVLLALQTDLMEVRAAAVRSATEAASPGTPDQRQRLDDACVGLAPERIRVITAAWGATRRLDARERAFAHHNGARMPGARRADRLGVWAVGGPYPAMLRLSGQAPEQPGLLPPTAVPADAGTAASCRKGTA